PDYRQDLASLYIKTKDYKDALKILDDLDKEFGLDADRDFLRNEIYTITGQDDKRIENLEQRLENNPENEDSYLKLIYRYSETGDNEKGLETTKECSETHQKSKLVHWALSKLYLDKNDTAKCMESMKIVMSSAEIIPDAKAKVLKDFVNFVSVNPEY